MIQCVPEWLSVFRLIPGENIFNNEGNQLWRKQLY
ncbi:hypothetical protein CLOBOL_01029 [Enterocloster bolteae ATCC BAA-613]|uniref:Uncharacterized protein n=1 Tax=Enterocloster bolteae (strain ATCC BAA-613 / DSM 15670 / CCUG 46953 / JCM 12243 / WAL 16351) TaxID=411902 RepID=A8RJU4_ENTBW|nr:hypothetical protein CLOBOL_01029 [Enterocloster bolteae ATCC BAA-613]